jgi:D-glycero-alpha-D-manno-heptose-7-phosphate kinase
MIVSKTPLRMSFVGGGSDLPSYYRQFGGAVLSTSIQKYIYICLNDRFEPGYRISYSKTENVNSIAEIDHKIVRKTLEEYPVKKGLEIVSIADIPSSGTGLGSSSSFTVGLLNVLNQYHGLANTKAILGAKSSEIEIVKCGEPIGKQDQYAAAFGGLNLIEFNTDNSVTVKEIHLNQEVQAELENNILAFYLGNTRSASAILAKQSSILATDFQKQETTKQMVKLAYNMYHDLSNNQIGDFGKQLHENWLLKKSISSDISTSDIDQIYTIGLENGAEGGKLLGAGAGGFFIFYAPKHTHATIEEKLKGLQKVSLGFDTHGSQIITL